jgi:dienelactone hydrolase
VDKNNINLYGVSLGGDVVMHMLARTSVHAAILGAPAPINFMRAGQGRAANVNRELAAASIKPVATPILILVGSKDSLQELDTVLHDLLTAENKRVRMEVYENGYHDFCMGPQGQNRQEPLLDSTLAALESTLKFLKKPAE